MAKRKRDPDYPQIGQQVDGWILVCHGDDTPTEWVEWLEPYIEAFLRLKQYSEEFGFDLIAGNPPQRIADVLAFCEEIGVHFDSSFWEGSMISGIYHFGWMKKGTVRNTKQLAKLLFKELRDHAHTQVRKKILNELTQIDDLDELIERTRHDRGDLIARSRELEKQLAFTNSHVQSLRKTIDGITAKESTEIDRACLNLCLALITNTKGRFVAGPFVLWDDGVVYAITSRGGVRLPPQSSPAILLKALEGANNIRVAKVSELTVIGGWLSGPHYRKGATEISGWATVWSDRENRKRSFSVDPPELAEQVEVIHAYYRDLTDSYGSTK